MTDTDTPTPRPVTHHAPAAGIPDAADDAASIAAVGAALRAGSGPIAVDAERASGYRYSQRAYLLQFGRAGAGVHLVDPLAAEALPDLAAFVNTEPWILHSATQDLPCLRECGFAPASVYDTELAAKILGRPKVGLGTLLEEELGVVLAKEHSAVDWSTRPLPPEWRSYAALDVEFLVELHDVLLHDLVAMGRDHWYEEERALLLTFTGPPLREEPWRRVSGIHALREPRRLAVVRALWTARDARARELDVSPGRVLHDSVIVDIARHQPASAKALAAMKPVHSRNARKDPDYWWSAIEEALHLSDDELPRRTVAEGNIPPPRSWAQRNPAAAARWERVRPATVAAAEELGLAPEVLIAPDIVRRLCWQGLELGMPAATVQELFVASGARAWQAAQLAQAVHLALVAD